MVTHEHLILKKLGSSALLTASMYDLPVPELLGNLKPCSCHTNALSYSSPRLYLTSVSWSTQHLWLRCVVAMHCNAVLFFNTEAAIVDKSMWPMLSEQDLHSYHKLY